MKMNKPLLLTALFVRDLLGHDESLIRIGRMGDNIKDFTTDYIGIDSLAPATRLSVSEQFDGVAEEMNHSQNWRIPVTMSFYGDNAWENVTKLVLLSSSQAGFDLQKKHGLGFFIARDITDVKILTGQQYGNRYEVTVNVQYNINIDVDTLRIDTARLKVWNDVSFLNTEIGSDPFFTSLDEEFLTASVNPFFAKTYTKTKTLEVVI